MSRGSLKRMKMLVGRASVPAQRQAARDGRPTNLLLFMNFS